MNTIDVLRCTIELTSPMIIGTGRGDSIQDSLFVTDANGLPVIPGTSLAGVLRSRWMETGSHLESEATLFGSAGGEDSAASRVEVSFGHIHDSNDQPVPYAASSSRLEDPLLTASGVLLSREHVRLGIRGSQQRGGLFEDSVVAAGHRFSFEISVRNSAPEVSQHILAMVADSATRIGAKTRGGMGSFQCVGSTHGRFELSDPNDLNRYVSLPADLCQPVPDGVLSDIQPSVVSAGTRQCIELHLHPESGWLFGGGASHPMYEREVEERDGIRSKSPDMSPFTEPRVVWKDGKGQLDASAPDVVIPASGIKGALRHRCAFYAHADAGQFADEIDAVDRLEEPEAVGRLFGCIPHPGEDAAAKPGQVFIEEARFSAQQMATKWIDHVSLDRFSGAPLDGRLFNEMAVFEDPGWILRIHVNTADLQSSDLHILRRALEDLASGDLSVGAGSGRGHGSFSGKVDWPSADEDWGKVVEVSSEEGSR